VAIRSAVPVRIVYGFVALQVKIIVNNEMGVWSPAVLEVKKQAFLQWPLFSP